MRRLSDVLAHLADLDGDPDVVNVLVAYETPHGRVEGLFSIIDNQKRFMTDVTEVAAHGANSPGTMN